ncbi:MAG TPA: hypothetical protein VFF59_02800 [Anaerolineae bacterium]|nr:hypothetical protein [Anaerolineae bacterium]
MPDVIFVVLPDLETCQDLLRAWQTVGVPTATILDSMGVHEIKGQGRDDLPLFPSMRTLLAHETPQRTMFAVVGDEVNIERVIAVSEQVVGSFDAPNSGILFVMPVTHVRGLRHG